MRALLGVAGATLAPSTLSLIRNMFHDEHERQFAIGVWIASFSVGGAIGPLVGGVLLEYFWWGSVFLVAVPVMVLLLLLGPMLLPEYRDPRRRAGSTSQRRPVAVAVLAVIYGLKQIAEHGFGWVPALIVLAGLVVGMLFVRRQSRLAYPLLDLACSASRLQRRDRRLRPVCLAMFGVYIFIAQYLQLVLGLTPLQAGLGDAAVGAGLRGRLAADAAARAPMAAGVDPGRGAGARRSASRCWRWSTGRRPSGAGR